jgi:hypothetical protein
MQIKLQRTAVQALDGVVLWKKVKEEQQCTG